MSIGVQFGCSPRILLKIVGLTCIVSVFLTILTCYVCKRYWKRSDSRDNQVYRVSCNTSSSPHVFPLESFQPLNPNAFFKSPEHVANLCGDLALFSTSQTQPTQLRAVFASSRATPSALCSYQHNISNNSQSLSLSRHRNHEPPPPYQLSVISGNATTTTSAASVSGQSGGGSSGAGVNVSANAANDNSNSNSICITNNTETTSEQNCVSPESDCNSREAANTEVKIPLSMCSHNSEPQQSIAFDIHTHHTRHSEHTNQQSRALRRMSQW